MQGVQSAFASEEKIPYRILQEMHFSSLLQEVDSQSILDIFGALQSVGGLTFRTCITLLVVNMSKV